jgi:outer membrane protein assembly factor BamE (lipoprotein component of BamABCDE complex)
MRASAHRLLLIGCLALSSCSWLAPPPMVRGNKVDAEQLKELVPGTSTKADVTAVIGSPTAVATFDDNRWLYISELTQPQIGRTLAALDQNVVVLNFDGKGVLQSIEKRTKADALPMTISSNKTPSPGTEASFFQQLLGNIGRYNPTGGMMPGIGGGAPSATH